MSGESPIECLDKHIAASLYAQCSERRDELRALIKRHNIGIAYDKEIRRTRSCIGPPQGHHQASIDEQSSGAIPRCSTATARSARPSSSRWRPRRSSRDRHPALYAIFSEFYQQYRAVGTET